GVLQPGASVPLAQPLERQAQRGELLADLIVKPARDPRALVLLGRDDSPQHRRDVGVGGLAGRDLRFELVGPLADAGLELGLYDPKGLGGLLLNREIAGNLRE